VLFEVAELLVIVDVVDWQVAHNDRLHNCSAIVSC